MEEDKTASSGKTLPCSSDKQMPFQPTFEHPWEKLPAASGVTWWSWGENRQPECGREERFRTTPAPPHLEERIPDLDLINFPYHLCHFQLGLRFFAAEKGTIVASLLRISPRTNRIFLLRLPHLKRQIRLKQQAPWYSLPNHIY